MHLLGIALIGVNVSLAFVEAVLLASALLHMALSLVLTRTDPASIQAKSWACQGVSLRLPSC